MKTAIAPSPGFAVWFFWISLLLIGLVSAGCAAPSVAPRSIAARAPAAPQVYPIGPGDVLEVSIHAGGVKQEEFTAEVSPKGALVSPLIGEVQVGGLTAHEAAGRLTALLGRDFFVNPQVLVAIKESARKVYVIGEVKKPGVYPIQEGLTALNACILAGGFSDYAAPNRARITRLSDDRPRVIELDLTRVQEGKADDVILAAGDRIDIPQRRF